MARGADCLPGAVTLAAVDGLTGLALSVWLYPVDGSLGPAGGMVRQVVLVGLVLERRWLRLVVLPSRLGQAWPVPMGGCHLGLRRRLPAGAWTDSPLGEPAGVWQLRQLLVWQAGAGRREG